MVKLRNIKQAGKLRRRTSLESVVCNQTRWSSTYDMLKRFFEIRGFIDDTDPELACFLPSGKELLELQKIMDDLSDFQIITKELQKSTISLSDVCAVFDATIAKFPSTAYYLAETSHIVHSPDFENAIVKVIDESFDELNILEKEIIRVFEESGVNNSIFVDQEELSLVQKAYKQKKRKVSHSNYMNLEFIPPTSNIVERLFSKARLVLTDYRKSMSPYTFECVMFLKANRDYGICQLYLEL